MLSPRCTWIPQQYSKAPSKITAAYFQMMKGTLAQNTAALSDTKQDCQVKATEGGAALKSLSEELKALAKARNVWRQISNVAALTLWLCSMIFGTRHRRSSTTLPKSSRMQPSTSRGLGSLRGSAGTRSLGSSKRPIQRMLNDFLADSVASQAEGKSS